jgi:membrane protein DedA with SNARE-associated domain
MDRIFEWLAHYGYGGLFVLLVLGIVGLPIPDETLLVVCGYLVFKGKLNPVATYLSAVAGSWCGISLSYTLGRTAGSAAVHRFGKFFHLTEARLEIVHRWFARAGHWTLFVGYFIVGVRHFTALVAGMSKLEFRSFAAYAWPGGAVWVGVFIVLGYLLGFLFGDRWEAVAELIHRDIVYASVALLIGVAAVWAIRRKVRRAAKS